MIGDEKDLAWRDIVSAVSSATAAARHLLTAIAPEQNLQLKEAIGYIDLGYSLARKDGVPARRIRMELIENASLMATVGKDVARQWLTPMTAVILEAKRAPENKAILMAAGRTYQAASKIKGLLDEERNSIQAIDPQLFRLHEDFLGKIEDVVFAKNRLEEGIKEEKADLELLKEKLTSVVLELIEMSLRNTECQFGYLEQRIKSANASYEKLPQPEPKMPSIGRPWYWPPPGASVPNTP